MAKRKKPPELTFQEHVADFLVRQEEYGVLEQSDIVDDYGTDARDEVFRALRKQLARTPLWMMFRDRLKVRGLEFHQLKAAGAIVGIELLDHIIFNRTGYFSFLEDGRL